jgi:hypothetical protein
MVATLLQQLLGRADDASLLAAIDAGRRATPKASVLRVRTSAAFVPSAWAAVRVMGFRLS